MYNYHRLFLGFLSLFISIIVVNAYTNAYGLSKQYISYQYPIRSAKNVLPTTGIGIRVSQKVDKNRLSNYVFSVRGSMSGIVNGSVVLADDERTIIYTPTTPFKPSEIVSVDLSVGDDLLKTSFDFTVSNTCLLADRKSVEEESCLVSVPFLQLPMDTLPTPTFTVWASGSPADGFTFIQTLRPSPNNIDGYLIAVDNAGVIRWKEYKPFVSPNFQPHKDGRYTYLQSSTIAKDSKFIILDSNLQEIGSIKAPSDYATRLHELLLLPNGHSMLIGRYTTIEDLSPQVPGGQTGVTVDQSVILELDASGNKVFEWRTEDHYKITDATHEDLTAQMVNYSFINALCIDNDGQLLASSRRMDEITKIDRETGNIIWRLGGKNNQFALLGDSVWFSHAHNIQALPNGHYILFDNGLYNTPKVSRGVEYEVDTSAKTVRQVWHFTHPDSICGEMMGSIQRLDNGNTLIGWGTNTARTFTEVTPEGKTSLEMSMSGTTWSYRVYKAVRTLPKSAVQNNKDITLVSASIYPNPATASAILTYNLAMPGSVLISIEDCLGRIINEVSDGYKSSGTYTHSLDLTSYPKGVYSCKVQTNGQISNSRIVIQ